MDSRPQPRHNPESHIEWHIVILSLIALILAGMLLFRMVQPHLEPYPVMEDIYPETLSGTEPTVIRDWNHVIAYVPLDDRTDNLEDVIYLAEASGFQIVMPEKDWYRTALDGQPLNANQTPYGNREKLFEWVHKMDRHGCNLFILSLDQLFSGGLVNSRSISQPQTFTFSNGAVMNETQAFDTWILSLADDPANRIYLFDSVVRLSPTVSYNGITEADYYALRAYGMAARPVLPDAQLTLDRIFAAYPLSADAITHVEETLPERWQNLLTPERITEYLNVRRRKLSLLDSVITAVHSRAGENLHLIIGIDDSSSTENIQYNELRYIRKRLGNGAALMPGLDSLARLLIAQTAQQEYDYRIRASVRYVGGSQKAPSSEFDLYTLEEVVRLHLEMFQAEQVPEREAELQFVIMTAPDDTSHASEYIEELLSLLEYNQLQHIPTVLDEASGNAYGDALEQALLQRVKFAGLIAFAGKYDQANVTGAAFAMGISRYLYLRCAADHTDETAGKANGTAGKTNGAADHTDKTIACDSAHARQMANSMALTEYILHTRELLNRYITEQNTDIHNMPPDSPAETRILQALDELFQPECQKVCENLRGTGVVSGLAPWRERRIEEISIHQPYFPWNRTFEISFTVTAELNAGVNYAQS